MKGPGKEDNTLETNKNILTQSHPQASHNTF